MKEIWHKATNTAFGCIAMYTRRFGQVTALSDSMKSKVIDEWFMLNTLMLQNLRVIKLPTSCKYYLTYLIPFTLFDSSGKLGR